MAIGSQGGFADIWRMHPEGERVVVRGGDSVAPPAYLNLSLSYACNLRCRICPSQSALDQGRSPRNYMPLELLDQVIATVLPFTAEVSLNSWGEPFIYPHIEHVLDAVRRHRCKIFMHTNGTVLDERKLELLVANFGRISFSIDAVGALFEQLRCNGKWETVDANMRWVLARRDPARLQVLIEPTLSASNLDSVLDTVAWADEVGLDMINFRLYQPFALGTEIPVTREEALPRLSEAAIYLRERGSRVRLHFNDYVAYYGDPPQPSYPTTAKSRLAEMPSYQYPVPRRQPGAHSHDLCRAPFEGLDIGVDGQMTVCCRSQEAPFGQIGSLEDFAEFWLGENMALLRASLGHDSANRLPLLPCAGCIKRETGCERAAVTYVEGVADGDDGFIQSGEVIPLAMVLRQDGHTFVGTLPLGVAWAEYGLAEDGVPLAHPGATMADIGALGAGRWTYWSDATHHGVAFSASDNTNAMTNGRRYALLRKGRGA